MQQAAILEAANIIGGLRVRPKAFAGLAVALAPNDADAAYDIQDAVHDWFRAHGFGARIGYKIGCTTPVMQNYMGIDHPCAGGLFEARLYTSPAEIDCASLNRGGVECEIAVEMGAPLDARDMTIDQGRAAEAIAALYPAIEVVDDRYQDIMGIGAATLIADDFCQSALVLGPRNTDWRDLDLRSLTGATAVNGTEVGTGIGADVLGHPLNALIWLAQHLAARGRALAEGEIVLLGSLVQCQWLQPGDAAATEIDGLGAVSVKFNP
jgi:2-oxo-3-hexenedioate decarboxylase/2-keto-4-pentenoate hydratase